jgi:hypothetical protein
VFTLFNIFCKLSAPQGPNGRLRFERKLRRCDSFSRCWHMILFIALMFNDEVLTVNNYWSLHNSYNSYVNKELSLQHANCSCVNIAPLIIDNHKSEWRTINAAIPSVLSMINASLRGFSRFRQIFPTTGKFLSNVVFYQSLYAFDVIGLQNIIHTGSCLPWCCPLLYQHWNVWRWWHLLPAFANDAVMLRLEVFKEIYRPL